MNSEILRILQTCFSRSWGGLELHSLLEAEGVTSLGHSVWFACCSGSRLEQEGKMRGVRMLPFQVSGFFHPSVIWRLGRFMRERKIDLVHCQHSKDLATAVPASRCGFGNVPVVLSKRVGSYIMKRDPLHRFTYSGVRRVLAISEVIRQNVIDTTPMSPAQVITLHHGVDVEQFSFLNADRSRVRRELGIGDEEIVIGFMGRFSAGKGHEEFLAAAATLVTRHRNLRFVIAGEASFGEQEYERRIKAQSARLQLDHAVMFIGFRSDVRDVMASFDIFAFPSHAESFGAVLVEAMAVERPVVSTNCDGVLDIVVDGKTGLFVNPERPAELADALSRLVENPQLRLQLGKAGRERVVELFDRKVLLKKLESVYRETVAEASRNR